MNITLILAHPKPCSFNHAIFDTAHEQLAAMGHNVFAHDLCAEHFDPCVSQEELEKPDLCPNDVRLYLKEVGESHGIVLLHPNWWGTPPAILKGWVDRVFRTGFAYKFTESGPVPLFGDKIVQIFSTSNTPKDVEINVHGDPLETFWRKIVFGLTGSKSFERRNFESVIMSTPEERTLWLNEVRDTVKRRFS